MAINVPKEYEVPLYLFHQGKNAEAYKLFGSHFAEKDGVSGVVFRVWAPKAADVSVVGDFNHWNREESYMKKISDGGIWELFIPGLKKFDNYKYSIKTERGQIKLKADPYGYHMETRPNTASKVYDISGYNWKDSKWMDEKKTKDVYRSPMNIYEVHLNSWFTKTDEEELFSYMQLAEKLVPYVKEMGYTHIEMMPIAEFPFDGSWGYQQIGYYAPTSRFGTPSDFMEFVDYCHTHGVGVILDWVPAHFPKDAAGLYEFDGDYCYEYSDPNKREHYNWGTRVFDWGKPEVQSFLISNANYWLSEYHIDGLRVDAVASMLYLDYDRQGGAWTPNKNGGNENLEAVDFLQNLNSCLFSRHPGLLMIAEESTAWPMVTKPVDIGGLGFNFKWNMGWMNDTLRYMGMDPYFRKDNHSLLTFMMMYAYSENYILPLSHDEVVHGKGSMLNKMFGEYDEKFAAYRTLLGYYMTMPGKKMLFMGGEFGQMLEWRYDDQLEWNVLEIDKHKRLHQYVKDLNHFYMENKALWELDTSWDGFRWVNEADSENSVLSYIRRGRHAADNVVVVANFTPVERPIYKIGVPLAGEYEVVFHSSAVKYGGNKRITKKVYKTKNMQFSDMMYTIEVAIDGNSVMFLKKKPADKAAASKKKTTASKTAKKTTDKTESATAKKAAVKKTTATKTAAKKTSTRTNKSAK